MKHSLIISILLMSSCSNVANTGLKSFEVKSRKDANFTLEAHALYPGEALKLSINNAPVYQSNLDSQKKGRDEHIFFRFPDSISSVQIHSIYKGKILFSKDITDTLKVRRVGLFISPPFPKSLDSVPTNPEWKPYWKHLSIDSAQRIVRIVPDTAIYWSCGLQPNSQ